MAAAAPFSVAFPEEHSLSIAGIRTSEGQDSHQGFVRRTGGKHGTHIPSVPGEQVQEPAGSVTEELLRRAFTLLTGPWAEHPSSGSQCPHMCGWHVPGSCSLGDNVILPHPICLFGHVKLTPDPVYLSFS